LKLRDVRVDDRPDSSNPHIITSIETVDRLISDVLSGGYIVHPNPLLNSLLIDNITTTYDSGIISTEQMLILGYVTSDTPKNIGTNVFPRDPNNPGTTKKKIISNPCKVILRL
jgi:hypothetical protein